MNKFLSKFFHWMVFAFGALFIFGLIAFVGLKIFAGTQLDTFIYKVEKKIGIAKRVEPFSKPNSVQKDFSNALRVSIPKEFIYTYVSSVEDLYKALKRANEKGDFVIYLLPGTYKIDKTLNINNENIIIMSSSGNPYDTIIQGSGMQSGIGNLIRVNKSYFKMDGITLTDASFHTVQVAGELDVDGVRFMNMIFQDSYQQLFKVSFGYNKNNASSDAGKILNSIFQYTRGVAPNWYTGGIDILGGKDWLIEGNIFRDIASPAERISQYGVHFWKNAKNNLVIGNMFINNDRGVGFGMGNTSFDDRIYMDNSGGKIKKNLIIHTDNEDPFADTGIALEQSPNTVVAENIIYLTHTYPRSIEYRFKETKGVLIRNNKTNKNISSRNGGQANLEDNVQLYQESEYLEYIQSFSDKMNIISIY